MPFTLVCDIEKSLEKVLSTDFWSCIFVFINFFLQFSAISQKYLDAVARFELKFLHMADKYVAASVTPFLFRETTQTLY